jgi:hypothetical protein
MYPTYATDKWPLQVVGMTTIWLLGSLGADGVQRRGRSCVRGAVDNGRQERVGADSGARREVTEMIGAVGLRQRSGGGDRMTEDAKRRVKKRRLAVRSVSRVLVGRTTFPKDLAVSVALKYYRQGLAYKPCGPLRPAKKLTGPPITEPTSKPNRREDPGQLRLLETLLLLERRSIAGDGHWRLSELKE